MGEVIGKIRRQIWRSTEGGCGKDVYEKGPTADQSCRSCWVFRAGREGQIYLKGEDEALEGEAGQGRRARVVKGEGEAHKGRGGD